MNMKGFFSVLQTVKAWTRKTIPDPKIRLFNTHVLLVCGIIHLRQEQSHVTMGELERVTTLAQSVVSRGLKHLIDHGLLKMNVDTRTFDFAMDLPPTIGDISTSNNSGISDQLEEFKAFVVQKLEGRVPRGGEALSDFVADVQQFKPTPKKERKGTKRLLGDAGL